MSSFVGGIKGIDSLPFAQDQSPPNQNRSQNRTLKRIFFPFMFIYCLKKETFTTNHGLRGRASDSKLLIGRIFLSLQLTPRISFPYCVGHLPIFWQFHVGPLLRKAFPNSDEVKKFFYTLFEEEEEEEPDLIVRFQRYRHKNDGRYCQPKHERKSAHLSDLPLEIFMYILKWVVSADLDLKSLEQILSCSRDEEIWKLACLSQVWGIKCVKKFYTQSWRHMYLENKTTYIRHGETSYIDETYRPWYLVEYYRYLRFFPEGKVLMLTTADNPYIALSKLHSRTPHFASVMVGHYRLYDNIVTAILKPPVKTTDNKAYRRRRRNQIDNDSNDSGQLTYHLLISRHNRQKSVMSPDNIRFLQFNKIEMTQLKINESGEPTCSVVECRSRGQKVMAGMGC
ncbi:F-box only protein 9 [Nymphon striatum]|nr:F-box only protein 9 [Nymphon striatum]